MLTDNRYLCKAKKKNNNEWIIGYLVKYNEHYYIYYEYADEMCQTGNYLSYKEVIPETVMLCTTISDMHGDLIFEGDIVRAIRRDGTPCIYGITFKAGCFWFGNYNWVEFLSIFSDIETINNIHNDDEDNKEPDCYISNEKPYPLCKGSGENKCHYCCFFEDYTDYNQPHPEEIIYEVHVKEEDDNK